MRWRNRRPLRRIDVTTWLIVLAVNSGTASALLFYLASPQQQLRAAGPWPARRRWWPATVCALVSLVVMMRLLAPMEAVFAWGVLLMFVASIAPFLGAWRARARAAAKADA